MPSFLNKCASLLQIGENYIEKLVSTASILNQSQMRLTFADGVFSARRVTISSFLFCTIPSSPSVIARRLTRDQEFVWLPATVAPMRRKKSDVPVSSLLLKGCGAVRCERRVDPFWRTVERPISKKRFSSPF